MTQIIFIILNFIISSIQRHLKYNINLIELIQVMSNHGSVLQNFNVELVKSLESIGERKENIIREIRKEEDRRKDLETQISKLKKELQQIEEVLENKYEVKNEFEKVIFNTENAFRKILENSRTLMNIIKKDEAVIERKLANN